MNLEVFLIQDKMFDLSIQVTNYNNHLKTFIWFQVTTPINL